MSREELESSLRASLVATSVGEMLGKIVKIVERLGRYETKTPFRKLLKISLIPSWAEEKIYVPIFRAGNTLASSGKLICRQLRYLDTDLGLKVFPGAFRQNNELLKLVTGQRTK